MENNKKKKLIIGVIVGVLVLTLATTFALWTYSKIGENQLLIAGDIYMKYTGTNNINVTNATPSDTYNKSDYFEFTVEGKNTYSKDIIYDIVLDHGKEPEDKTRNVRIDDKFLKFRLVKVTKEDTEEELIQEGNYENIIEKRIWVDRISANTTNETSTKYRLYVWISSDIKIGLGDNVDYEMDTWNNNVYASIKVTVTGDFAEKGINDEEMPTLKLSEESGIINQEASTTFTATANTEGTFTVIPDEPSIATASVEPETGTMTTVTVNAEGIGTTNIKVNFKPKSAKYKETTASYSLKVQSLVLSERIKDQLTDENSTNDGETTFLSGDNNTINFNYVWYSGKLWRITAINSDNTMKMITQDDITATNWGTNTTYKDSWIYQWLNEDFLDTLENQENIIVQNAKWNSTEDGNEIPVKPSTDDSAPMVEGNVGLLNAYEYYQAYKKANVKTNYLYIGYFWWLITPYSNLAVRIVDHNGPLAYFSTAVNTIGIRPAVNLKSDIKILEGKGTMESPYRINGDKDIAKVNDKLNSRVSGEYVNFDNKVYRIVSIENGTTKLTSVDYVRDNKGAVMTKNFSNVNTDVLYGSGTTTSEDNWAGYLNSTWYYSISETYRNMLVEGTYYLGQYGDNVSYKNTICSTSNTTEKTSKCSKTSSTWTGYVGLPRVGEMFSVMLGNGDTDTLTNIWLITPYNGSLVRNVDKNVGLDYRTGYPSSDLYGVRPTITLDSNVLISSGKGTEKSLYEIKCDSCS